MDEREKKILQRLIEAATPFLSDRIVDETDGTIPLMNELERAIDEAREQFNLE